MRKNGQPKPKSNGMLFKFSDEINRFLRREKRNTGKSMKRVVEDAIREYRDARRAGRLPASTLNPQ
jgi:hypothetical protein